MSGRSRDWWQGRIDMLADQAREADFDLSHALFMEMSLGARMLPHVHEDHEVSSAATTAYKKALASVWLACGDAEYHGYPGMAPSVPGLPR